MTKAQLGMFIAKEFDLYIKVILIQSFFFALLNQSSQQCQYYQCHSRFLAGPSGISLDQLVLVALYSPVEGSWQADVVF